MEEKNENGERRLPELSVEFDADTEVIKDQYTYNIVGKNPGNLFRFHDPVKCTL